jgi:thiol-disulfide isomerase/thioredoxin
MRPAFMFFLIVVALLAFTGCSKSPEEKRMSPDSLVSASLTHLPEGPSLADYYRPVRILLQEQPDEKLSKEPAYESQNPRYGTISIGNGPDDRITLVLDEPKTAEPTVYIDQNNDEDLTNDDAPQWLHKEEGFVLFRATVNVTYKTENRPETLPYRLVFYRFEDREPDFIFYHRDEYRHGEITIGEHTYKLAVFDDDGDGIFNDLTDCAFFIDLDSDGTIGGGMESHEYYRCDELFTVDGTTYRVEDIDLAGTQINIGISSIDAPQKPNLLPGHRATDFTGTDLAGNRISLSDYRGKVVLLDFWATWCRPCLAEIPHLKAIQAKYEDAGFTIIGVNLDMSRQPVEALVNEAGITWPQIYDDTGWKNEIAELYRVTGIPSTFLIDRNGIIRHRNLRGPALDRAVASLVGAETAKR